MIEPKIYTIVESEGSGKQNTLKWRTKRGVNELRPPPGGAPAQISVVSSMFFQKNFYLS